MIKWLEVNTAQELIKLVEKNIDKNIRNALEETALKVAIRIEKKVDAWYNSRTPETYVNRTYQVIKAITIGEVEKDGHTWQIDVFFDGSKLTESVDPANGGWVSHKLSQGQRVHFWDMMENGWHLPNRSRNFKGHGAIQDAIDWIEVGKFAQEIAKILKQDGFEIVKIER